MTNTGNTSLKVSIYLQCVHGVCRQVVSFQHGEFGSDRASEYQNPCVVVSSHRARRGGKMRKCLWIILTVLLVAFVAPESHGDTFTATFTCSGGPCFITPATVHDTSFPSPTTVDVTIFGTSFPIPLLAGDKSTDVYSWATGDISVQQQAFSILDVNTGDNPECQLLFSTVTCGLGTVDPNVYPGYETGALVFAAVAEPSSVALMLTGVGLLFVIGKRRSLGLHQAS
jgi:hypothetical protein